MVTDNNTENTYDLSQPTSLAVLNFPSLTEQHAARFRRQTMFIMGAILGAVLGFDLGDMLYGEAGIHDDFTGYVWAVGGSMLAGFGVTIYAGKKEERRKTRVMGLLGGLAAGAAIFDPTLVIQSVLILLASGVGGGLLIWATESKKRCPHCQFKQQCSHIVCRNFVCLKILKPADSPETRPIMYWKDAASFLQQNRLNYLESLEFIKHNWKYNGPRIKVRFRLSEVCRDR